MYVGHACFSWISFVGLIPTNTKKIKKKKKFQPYLFIIYKLNNFLLYFPAQIWECHDIFPRRIFSERHLDNHSVGPQAYVAIYTRVVRCRNLPSYLHMYIYPCFINFSPKSQSSRVVANCNSSLRISHLTQNLPRYINQIPRSTSSDLGVPPTPPCFFPLYADSRNLVSFYWGYGETRVSTGLSLLFCRCVRRNRNGIRI